METPNNYMITKMASRGSIIPDPSPMLPRPPSYGPLPAPSRLWSNSLDLVSLFLTHYTRTQTRSPAPLKYIRNTPSLPSNEIVSPQYPPFTMAASGTSNPLPMKLKLGFCNAQNTRQQELPPATKLYSWIMRLITFYLVAIYNIRLLFSLL